MKPFKLLFLSSIIALFFSSCDTPFEDDFFVEEVVSSYDLWYIDFHRTTGSGDIPFMSRAFTLSFINGTMYANNNITDIGKTGNGFGIPVGDYNGFNGLLNIEHDIDGRNNFVIDQLSSNQIRVYHPNANVSYYLTGYQRNNFDYDQLFYDNIEYFLQEYVAWEKTNVSGGVPTIFDEENYLQFTPENNSTFYASHDNLGNNINTILWDFTGNYQIFDVFGYNDLKILTLNYDSGDTEEFELSVLNDERIELYHYNSGTNYQYSGKGALQFLKGEKETSKNTRNNNRKRTIMKRVTKKRKSSN